MNFKVEKVIKYNDILGNEYDSSELAGKSNELISSRLLEYIGENLLVTHSNGKVDKLASAIQILDNLSLTDKCISDINEMMLKNNPMVKG